MILQNITILQNTNLLFVPFVRDVVDDVLTYLLFSSSTQSRNCDFSPMLSIPVHLVLGRLI
jgi:hypothetical protein